MIHTCINTHSAVSTLTVLSQHPLWSVRTPLQYSPIARCTVPVCGLCVSLVSVILYRLYSTHTYELRHDRRPPREKHLSAADCGDTRYHSVIITYHSSRARAVGYNTRLCVSTLCQHCVNTVSTPVFLCQHLLCQHLFRRLNSSYLTQICVPTLKRKP